MARFRWQRSKWVVQQTFHQGLKAFRVVLRAAHLNQPNPHMLMSAAISDAAVCGRLGIDIMLTKTKSNKSLIMMTHRSF